MGRLVGLGRREASAVILRASPRPDRGHRFREFRAGDRPSRVARLGPPVERASPTSVRRGGRRGPRRTRPLGRRHVGAGRQPDGEPCAAPAGAPRRRGACSTSLWPSDANPRTGASERAVPGALQPAMTACGCAVVLRSDRIRADPDSAFPLTRSGRRDLRVGALAQIDLETASQSHVALPTLETRPRRHRPDHRPRVRR